MLLDDDILIDAGTGVSNLSIDEMSRIDHILVTHAHLDHVACIPFSVDTVGSIRAKPIIVHALQATVDILQQHLFNW
jgi:cAMP phosphodiesterase